MIGFELGWGGWPDQMGIRLTSASTVVVVEVGAELGNKYCWWKLLRRLRKQVTFTNTNFYLKYYGGYVIK